MSDDFLDKDFNFDDEVPEVGEVEFPTYTDFGEIQLVGRKKVEMFVKGESITFPNFLIDGLPYTRGGMKEGGETTAIFIAHHGVNQSTQEAFTRVRVFTNLPNIRVNKYKVSKYPAIILNDKQKEQLEGEDYTYIADWPNLQYIALQEALKALPEKKADFRKGKRLFFAGDNFNTGTKPRPNPYGEGQIYDRYWYNFRFFDSKEEMEKARAAYAKERGFNNSDTSVATSQTKDYYPEQWKTDIDGMVTIVKQWHGEGKLLPEIAENAMLIVDGKPAQGINGESVPVKKVLSEILDIPEPMISLE